MHRFLPLLRLFGRDERGVFAVLFGLMAIVLVALGGAVVDYVWLEQTRSRSQIALDAAALALQPEIFDTTITREQIRQRAEALMIERIGDDRITASIDLADVVINVDDGSLYLAAEMEMPTIFVNLVGVPNMGARIQSEATRKKLALEVAFVLDNSGSMTYTGAGANGTRQRIQFLKDAAKCAVNILFYKDVVDSTLNPDTCIPATGAELLEDVKVAIVPFTMFVNVGTGNKTAAWMDQTGASVIANDNFDNDDDETTLPTSVPNRFALFTATGEAWRGCVEARPHIKTGTLTTEYLDTDDTAAVAANTLYVPLFSPDAADSIGGNNYITNDSPAVCDRPQTSPTATQCTVVQRRSGCNASMNNGGTCNTTTVVSRTPSGPVNFASNAKYTGAYYGAHAPSCECRTPSYGNWTQTNSNTGNNRTFERTYTCNGGGYQPLGLSNREYFERICKYHQTVSGSTFSAGPNGDCTRTAILPLTTTPATAITTIDGMIAEGGTNIHEGTAWGFRALSPSLPFDQGAPYDEATAKVLIVMTDGENTAYNLPPPANPYYCDATRAGFNGSCYNSAYGFPYNSRNTTTGSTSTGNIERLGVSGATNAALVTAMNERTRQTCENAKAAGITVYVIGLATSQAVQSTQAEVEDMLADCASTRDKAYFPQTPGALKSVFEAIADDLTALRLAQ